MTLSEYLAAALRTETLDQEAIANRTSGKLRLLHAIMDISSEGGELTDALKAHLFYGKPLDEVNLKEELGDILWFTAVALDVLGLTFEEVMEANISKLKARYPLKFQESLAINRDLDAERVALQESRWEKAVAHAREVLDQYVAIGPSGVFGATLITHSLDLYSEGDRSDALLESLEGFK